MPIQNGSLKGATAAQLRAQLRQLEAEELKDAGAASVDGAADVGKVDAKKTGGPTGLDRAAEVGQVGPATQSNAARVVQLLRSAGVFHDEKTLVAHLRSGLGDVGAIRSAMREAFGETGDFLWHNDLKEFMAPDRAEAMKAQAERLGGVQAKLEKAESLDELKELAESVKGDFLPARMRNALMLSIRRKDKGEAIKHYEETAARFPAYAQDDIGQEYYLVALNLAATDAVKAASKAKKNGEPEADIQEKCQQACQLLSKGILEGKRYVAQRSSFDEAHPEFVRVTPDSLDNMPSVSDERLAAIGKAYKVAVDLLDLAKDTPELGDLKKLIAAEEADAFGGVPDNLDFKQTALEVSTRYYESAYAQDFGYYPAMPSVYNNIELGNLDRAKEMAEMAKLSCKMAGGLESTDYWVLASQLELALITGDDEAALKVAPKVLKHGNESWEIGSTANWMSRLAQIRKDTGVPDDEVKVLDFVAKALTARSETLQEHSDARDALVEQFKGQPELRDKALESLKTRQQEQGETWSKKTLKTMFKLVDPAPVVVDPNVEKGREVANAIREKTSTMRRITTAHSAGARIHLGGNGKYGGNIPDVAITRATRKIAMQMLSDWGITAETPKEEFHDTLNREVTRIFRLEKPDGSRPAEFHDSKEHKQQDAFDQLRNVLFMSRTLGDDTTELMTLARMGIGDCRPTNQLGLYLTSLYQRNVESHHLRKAFQSLPGGKADHAEFEKQMGKVAESQQWEPRLASVVIHGKIQMHEPFEYDTDKEGKLKPSDTFQEIEPHTMMVWLQTDESGAATSFRTRDMFHHDKYDLKDRELGPENVVDPEGFAAGKMGIPTNDGEHADVKFEFSWHSGISVRPADTEIEAVSAGSFIAGAPVSDATLPEMKDGKLSETRGDVARSFLKLRDDILREFGGPDVTDAD